MHWTLLSVVILHVHFIWKSILDIKYLYTRSHLNYLQFTGKMVFLMKPQIILISVGDLSEGKRLLYFGGEKTIPGNSV